MGQFWTDIWPPDSRRMYDSITLGLPQLPPGVSMAEVVQDSEERELIAAAAADRVTAAQVSQEPAARHAGHLTGHRAYGRRQAFSSCMHHAQQARGQLQHCLTQLGAGQVMFLLRACMMHRHTPMMTTQSSLVRRWNSCTGTCGTAAT